MSNINYEDHMKVIHSLINKYKEKVFYEDLLQECTIKLWELCKNWNNQLENFGVYLFKNMEWFINKWYRSEVKYINVNYIENYEDINKTNILAVNDDISNHYIKVLKDYPSYAISFNKKLINLDTMKEIKQNARGQAFIWLNNKSKGLNINKIMKEYYPEIEL